MFQIIEQDDPFTLACLVAILYAIATQMASGAVRTWGKRVGGVSYILFCAYAICQLHSMDAADLLHIAFRGLFAAALTVTISWLALSILVFCICSLRDHLLRLNPTESRDEPRLPKPEPVVEPPQQPATPPPPPTSEERAAAALQRYESRLQLIANADLDETERQAARDRAKQQYLRELDETMR